MTLLIKTLPLIFPKLRLWSEVLPKKYLVIRLMMRIALTSGHSEKKFNGK